MDGAQESTNNENRVEKPQCKLVAVIPAYNEDRFIGSVILKVKELIPDVIVVDDGSTDSTAWVAASAGAIVIRHQVNQGKGISLNTGLLKAREFSPDAVVVLDADGQHDPGEIPTIVSRVLQCRGCSPPCAWAFTIDTADDDLEQDLSEEVPREGAGEPDDLRENDFGPEGEEKQEQETGSEIVDEKADIVIGSRYITNTSNVPKHRVMGHVFFNWFTKFSTRVNSTDSQSGFRAFSPKALDLLVFSSEGFSVESEMQMLAHEHDLKIVEVPITIGYDEKPKRNVFRQGIQVMGGIIRLIGQYRPLLFFGVPGIIFMVSGITMGLLVVNIFQRSGDLAVGYAMISVLLSVLGLVSFSTGLILHSVRGLLIDLLKKI